MIIQRVVLVFSALVVAAFSFPSQTIVEYKPKLNNQFNTKNIDEPLVVIVEEKDSKSSGSVIVQFVYNGNVKDGREGLNSERYNIEENSKDQSELNNNTTEKNRPNSDAISNKTEDAISKKEIITKLEAVKSKFEQKKQFFNKKAEWIPDFNKDVSMPTKAQYFSYPSNAVPPFPELIYGKPVPENLKIINTKPETFLLNSNFNARPKFSEPALYPRTVYNTEFDIPFF